MQGYIVLFVVTVIVSVCLSLAFFDALHNTDEFRVRYNKERTSMWQRINELLEANDNLNARVWELEKKIKEMRVVDDGK